MTSLFHLAGNVYHILSEIAIAGAKQKSDTQNAPFIVLIISPNDQMTSFKSLLYMSILKYVTIRKRRDS